MGNNGSGTLVLPNDIFFSHVSESLAEGKTVTFIVKGYSMYPFFRNGKDRVCMAGYDGRELRKGEVILFRYRGKYVMHRIYGVETDPGGTTVYRTVGDGNVRGRETAVPCEIAGVALKRLTPSMKEWSCSSWSWRFLSALWMRLYCVRRWCLAVLRRIYR